jgi:hypothetical protein
MTAFTCHASCAHPASEDEITDFGENKTLVAGVKETDALFRVAEETLAVGRSPRSRGTRG